MTLDYFYGQSGELFSYFRIPKALFQDHRFRQLSTDARTLYGILLDRMSLSAKNGWLDEQGRVYIIYTVREVQESLCCAEHKAVKLFRELEDIDLIERKRRGLGRPSLIYVKDFSSGLPKAQVQNCPNSNSSAAESAILEQPKPQANKTDMSKKLDHIDDAVSGFFSVMHMAMKHELGSAEPYFAATSPVLDLTVIRPDDAPHILACFDEADEGIGISENEPLGFRYNPKQVVKLMGQRYLVGPVIFHRFDEDGNFASLTMGDMYTIQKYLEAKSVTLMIDRDKLTCICID